MSESKT